ncbi:hypothetical protein BTVI_00839 [Pitangus sulphuratus]|nr:hypothetical protein BTVI_00839 [Pitangus sulphuratus]
MLKEAKAAITQYRLKSGYTTSMLQHLFVATLLTSYDIRMMITTLLSPHQQLQFYQKWQTFCEAAAATIRQQEDPLYGVTSQMLLGAGPFAREEWQVRFANEVLLLSQELAHKSLQSVQDDNPTPSFSSVKQGATEPFGKFVDRLHNAIGSNPDLDDEMKSKFPDLLAYNNANKKTKWALSVLPRGATTGQMLEAADRMIKQEKAAYMVATFEAAVKPLVPKKDTSGKVDRKYYNCGKKGHFKAQCPTGQKNGSQGIAVTKRCENGHLKNHNIFEWKKKGNGKLSTPVPRAMTQNQGAWTAAAQPPPVDVATAVDVTLETQEVVLIDSALKGPLGRGLSALLIGRSSVS